MIFNIYLFLYPIKERSERYHRIFSSQRENDLSPTVLNFSNFPKLLQKRVCSNEKEMVTSSVLAATVGSIRLVKLVLLPCLLLLDKQPTSETSPAAILAILSFSKHCDSGMPNTRPPAESETRMDHFDRIENIRHDMDEELSVNDV